MEFVLAFFQGHIITCPVSFRAQILFWLLYVERSRGTISRSIFAYPFKYEKKMTSHYAQTVHLRDSADCSEIGFCKNCPAIAQLLGHVTSSTRQHACPAVPRQITQSALDEAELKSRPIFMGTRSRSLQLPTHIVERLLEVRAHCD
jgi:hypothetical protein